MKKLFTSIVLLGLIFSYNARGVNTGTYNLPTVPYPTLKAIINALNEEGITGAGAGVTINLSRNEALGAYILGSDILNPTSVTKSITINGGGYTLTAHSGTGSADAIFTVQGTDNVILDNIKFVEASTNTTATSMMEWGVAAVKLSAADGVNTLNVTNCEITLNNANTTAASGISPAGTCGVFIGNCSAISTANINTSATSGIHEGFYVFNNKITNVNHGIYCVGNKVTADGSAANDRYLTISSNTIENFTHNGIAISYFNGDLVEKNQINNVNSGGTPPSENLLFGIKYINDPTLETNTNWTCSGNKIKLSINSAGTYTATGIMTQLKGSGISDINKDTIELVSLGSSAQLIGIFSQNNSGALKISENVLWNFATQTTNEQPVFGILSGYSQIALALSTYIYPSSSVIDKNVITDFDVSSGISSTLNRIMLCCDDNFTTGSSAFTNNVIKNIVINDTSYRLVGYGGLYIDAVTFAHTTTVTGNTFDNISISGATNTTPIWLFIPAGPYPSSNNAIFSKNKISRISTTLGHVGIYHVDFARSCTITNDTVSDITSEALNAVGVYSGFAATGVAVSSITVSGCSFKNIKSNSTTGTTFAAAIYNSPTVGTISKTATINVTNNLIQNIQNANATGTAEGVNIPAGTATHNISNNMISNVSASANTTAFSSSFGISLQNTGSNNVYYNTVNLSSTPASGYGATGLLFNPGATNAIQNNILRVDVTAGTDNNVAAVRGISGSASAAPATSAFAASNNIYHTPQGINNFLFVQGTTNSTLVNGYHQGGLTENGTKNITNDIFFNSNCDKSIYHAFMGSREKGTFTEDNLTAMTGGFFAPTDITYAEGGAKDVSTVITDIILVARSGGSSDIGALEFNGKNLPEMKIDITSSTGLDTACIYRLPTLTATIPDFFKRVSYQWFRATTEIPGETTKFITVTPVTAEYIIQVFDSVTGCEYKSAPFRMTIVPPPPALITYYDSLVFCETSAVVLQANKGKGFIYTWFFNGGEIFGETDDHLVAEKSGEYSLMVNTALGCPSSSTVLTIKVYPLPTPVITSPGPRLLTTGLYYSYQWYKNNVKLDDTDATNRTLYIKSTDMYGDGAYSVEVTDANGCTAKSETFLYSLGIKETSVSALIKIKIYPNPSSDVLNIVSPVPVTAVLSDLTGRTIIRQEDAKSIQIGNLSEGMYLLTLTDKEGQLIKAEKINKIR